MTDGVRLKGGMGDPAMDYPPQVDTRGRRGEVLTGRVEPSLQGLKPLEFKVAATNQCVAPKGSHLHALHHSQHKGSTDSGEGVAIALLSLPSGVSCQPKGVEKLMGSRG